MNTFPSSAISPAAMPIANEQKLRPEALTASPIDPGV
jgi:hypothetical protein